MLVAGFGGAANFGLTVGVFSDPQLFNDAGGEALRGCGARTRASRYAAEFKIGSVTPPSVLPGDVDQPRRGMEADLRPRKSVETEMNPRLSI